MTDVGGSGVRRWGREEEEEVVVGRDEVNLRRLHGEGKGKSVESRNTTLLM
jgi:hypothetical protein